MASDRLHSQTILSLPSQYHLVSVKTQLPWSSLKEPQGGKQERVPLTESLYPVFTVEPLQDPGITRNKEYCVKSNTMHISNIDVSYNLYANVVALSDCGYNGLLLHFAHKLMTFSIGFYGG